MALGGKRSKKSSKKGKSRNKDSEDTWVTLGSILESKQGNLYFKAEDYYGELYFVEKESGKAYRVESATYQDPYKDAPDFVEKVIRANLDGDTMILVDED